MRLRVGPVDHDLTTRALVFGVLRPPRSSSAMAAAASDVPLDDILARADRLVAEGADLLAVGGMPDGAQVGEDEELEGLVPVVAALRARFDVPLSVDTWRSQVLGDCCAAGAAVAGDSSGFVDEAYLPTAVRVGATVVATHSRLPPGEADVVADVRRVLGERVTRARAAGLADDRIIVDPGLDLGKSPAQSLTLLRETAALADLGLPLLLDAADKRFLGMALGLEPDERRLASCAAAALGIARGGRIVRASDVRGARRVVDVLQAVLAARLVQVEQRPETQDA